jgi:8-oxo-dGTP diphosphatase
MSNQEQIKARPEISADQVVVVMAIIKDKERLFLMKRNDPGTNEHGKYEFPGGKVNFGEGPEQAVVREAKEETGLDVKVAGFYPKVLSHIFSPNVRHPKSSLHVILLGFFCEIISGEMNLNKEEVIDAGFFSEKEVDLSMCLSPIPEIFKTLGK